MATAQTIEPEVKPDDAAAPPDERFWVKYSPNQELPVSGLSSLSIHALILLLLIGLFMVVGSTRERAMPVEALAIEGEGPDTGGGGGDPNGGQISDVGAARTEFAVASGLPQANHVSNLGPLPEVRDTVDIEIKPEANRTVPDADAAKARLQKLAGGGTDTSGRPQSKGQGGPGSGGGQGNGSGLGKGSGVGIGGAPSIRQKRNKRWTLSFDTVDGRDYLRQLSSLGAELIAEFPDKSRMMYRKLNESPVPGEPIDPEILTHMVWVDERPTAVGDLASAMHLPKTPTSIRAYFPYALEDELLKLELAFRNKKEDQIHSTIFRVLPQQGGSYKLVVAEQKYTH
jgi:hypothetical protein